MWDKIGLISRESKIWDNFAQSFLQVYFLTYGREKEKMFIDYFPTVKLLNNKWHLNPILYSLLSPFLYSTELSNVDIYKVNQLSGALPAVISKILYRKKLIIRCGYQFSFFLRKQRQNKIKILLSLILEKISFFLANKIIVTSVSDKEYILSHHKVNPDKITIIPNGVDIESFKILKDVKKEQGRILFVGRLTEQKNIFSLLEAVKNIKNAHLVLIGMGHLKDKIVNKATADGIKVTFIDSVNNNKLPIEYNKAEVFILPSLFEGNPKVLLEAMACGLAVIGANIDGINNIIKDKFSGILCKPSSESLRISIEEVLSNKYLSTTLGNNARKYIEENFDLCKLIKKEIESIY